MTPSIQYYLNLFTPEYQNSPKLLAFAEVLIQYLEDQRVCVESFQAAFDLDTAVGVQLDVLGQIVNVGRTLPFEPTSGSPVLGDTDYRLLLRATIARNSWNGRMDSLQAIWQVLFPAGQILVVDHQNMNMTVLIMGTFTQIQKDMITNGLIVPRPEGVLINYEFAVEPFFGFDSNSYISGFDTGHWT